MENYTLTAKSRVFAQNKHNNQIVVGVNRFEHKFLPGHTSIMEIAISNSFPELNLFGMSIDCNNWNVYELRKMN